MTAALYTHGGETMTLAGWARRTGIGYQTLVSRIKTGWPLKRALTKSVRPKEPYEYYNRCYRRPANRSTKARMRQLFMWRLGRHCTHDLIIDFLWGDDPDGGPLKVDNIIAIYVHRLRRKGWNIESRPGQGYICHSTGRPAWVDAFVGQLTPWERGMVTRMCEAPVPRERLEALYGEALPGLIEDLKAKLATIGVRIVGEDEYRLEEGDG